MSETQRFTFLAEDGAPVPAGDARHVATHDARTGLVWLLAYLNKGERAEQQVLKAEAATLTLFGEQCRLPTIEELTSIVDYGRSKPACDPEAFPNTKPNYHWSSSVVVGDPQYAWGVFFSGGSVFSNHRDDGGFARAVAGPVSALPGQ